MVDVSKYRKMFIDEAKEHLSSLSKNLLSLEKSPKDASALNEAFRSVHTLKGMSATMGYEDIEKLSHSMENVFGILRKGGHLKSSTIDVMFECLNTLENLVEDAASGKTVKRDLSPLYKKLGSALEKKEDGEVSVVKQEEKREKIISPTIRVDIEKLQALQNLVEELSIAKMRLLQISGKHGIPELNEITVTIDRLTSELQDRVMQMRMFPVDYIFDRFPRTVRDLSRKTGKEIDFTVEGREIELDRLVLDEINDAVMHLLRNAVDHGIESVEERKKTGKNRAGKIMLSARREGNYVVISVSDDGRGIDLEGIKNVAVERKIISANEASGMTESDVYEFLGAPGLSTTKKITELSGRGVGFDVVKSKIRSLGGGVRISSKKNEGTNVELRLPLTTAIIQSLLVGVENEKYAVPLDSVKEIVALRKEDLKSVERKEIFTYREKVLPLLRLKNVLSVPGNGSRIGPVVVVERNESLLGLMVDTLIGQQETVVKPLEGMLKGRKEFAGATILGDGSVALILDIGGLI